MKIHSYTFTFTTLSLVNAFVLHNGSTIQRNSKQLNLAEEPSRDQRTSRPKKQKKRRFAQDVEPTVSFLPSSVQDMKPSTRQPKSSSDIPRSDDMRSKSMLLNTKSIEELENIMAKRWGTSEDKWVADFSEWEIDEESENVGLSSDQNRKIKSRGVLNPWDKEERKIQNEHHSARKDEESKRSFETMNAYDLQSKVLSRVKRNQERLQQRQENGTKKSFDLEMDFYDEDDEGFESGDVESEMNDFYNNIISPKPVAGSGSSKIHGREERKDFFFNSSPVTSVEVTATPEKEVPTKTSQKEKVKKILGKPLLDEYGKEIYLTLDRAKKYAEKIVMDANENDDTLKLDDKTSSWEDIGITNPILLQNLKSMICNSPLPVQDTACPPIVSGNDVLVSTHTGSGKTLAFLVPLAERMLFQAGENNEGVKVLVIAPGRELASQIVAVARDLLKETGLTVALAIGGTPFSRNFDQIRKKKPDFIIGTPGRFAELVVGQPGEKGGKLKIANLQAVVLDECDALLEYEPHSEPTAAIIDALKRRHGNSLQSILCSATAGDLLGKSLLDNLLRQGYAHARTDDKEKLVTSGTGQTTRVSRTAIHGVVRVPHKRFVLDTLKKILYTEPTPQQVLIFVDNSRRVGIVVEKLAEMGIIAAPLHGGSGSEKSDRTEVNKLFREGFIGIVVATEMAARGIDAPYLTHVINLDLPTDASHYAHRAGRCGRGGRPGVVLNIAVGPREKNVPFKFADALDIDMHVTELQNGKLVAVESKAKDSSAEES